MYVIVFLKPLYFFHPFPLFRLRYCNHSTTFLWRCGGVTWLVLFSVAIYSKVKASPPFSEALRASEEYFVLKVLWIIQLVYGNRSLAWSGTQGSNSSCVRYRLIQSTLCEERKISFSCLDSSPIFRLEFS